MAQAVHLSFKSSKNVDGSFLSLMNDLKSRQQDFYAPNDVSRTLGICPPLFNGLHHYLYAFFHFLYEMIFDINFRDTFTVANRLNSPKQRKIN